MSAWLLVLTYILKAHLYQPWDYNVLVTTYRSLLMYKQMCMQVQYGRWYSRCAKFIVHLHAWNEMMYMES